MNKLRKYLITFAPKKPHEYDYFVVTVLAESKTRATIRAKLKLRAHLDAISGDIRQLRAPKIHSYTDGGVYIL